MTEAASAGERHGVGAVRTVRGKYLNITSYKRNGTAVATPVWFVEQGGRLLVETDAASGKVKRIRHNPAVLVAECSASGRLRGDQLSAVAELLPSPKSPGCIAWSRRSTAPTWLSSGRCGPCRLHCTRTGRARVR
jgi:hypothetical protein